MTIHSNIYIYVAYEHVLNIGYTYCYKYLFIPKSYY